MNTPQFRFHEDLELLTAPTDRIPTVRMTSIVQKKMHKETVCTERPRNDFQEEPILARVPLLIFLCIFTLYLLLLLRGVGMLLYIMVLVGNKLMR